jgi:hypothetical protein
LESPDRGKVRTTNEDQFLIAELTKAMRVWQTSLPEPKVQVGEEHAHLFLVADGRATSAISTESRPCRIPEVTLSRFPDGLSAVTR